MHLKEIDFTANKVKLNVKLSGEDRSITPGCLTEMIATFKKEKKKAWFLRGGKLEYKGPK